MSDVERDIPVSIDGVRAHDAVVEAALETGSTPVPARFGQRFADDDACAARADQPRPTSVESLLASMQGFVEMTLIITPSTRRMLRDLEPVIPEMFEPAVRGHGPALPRDAARARGGDGRRRRTRRTNSRRRLAEATESVRAPVARSIRPATPTAASDHLASAWRATTSANYRRAVATVEREREFQFLVIGPRAPYSFCALARTRAGCTA